MHSTSDTTEEVARSKSPPQGLTLRKKKSSISKEKTPTQRSLSLSPKDTIYAAMRPLGLAPKSSFSHQHPCAGNKADRYSYSMYVSRNLERVMLIELPQNEDHHTIRRGKAGADNVRLQRGETVAQAPLAPRRAKESRGRCVPEAGRLTEGYPFLALRGGAGKSVEPQPLTRGQKECPPRRQMP